MRQPTRLLTFTLTTLLCAHASAHAQRGELGEPIERESSRLDGFPGTFNAAMQAPGEWRLELGTTPTLSYGLHPDATVSTSLAPIVSWATLHPAVSAELRYRLWYNHRWAVVGAFGGMLLEFPKVGRLASPGSRRRPRGRSRRH